MKIILFCVLSLFVARGSFAKNSDEAVFWKWFVENQSRFEHFEREQDILLNELSDAIHAYRSGLVFEVGAKKKAGVREIIISADGIKELFPAVSKLVATAPKIEGWSVIAFRPRMDDYARLTVEYRGRSFDPKEIWFHPRTNDGRFEVIFYHPTYRDEDRPLIISGSYILLDMALGEYDVVTGISQLDHQLLPENPAAKGLKPFSELRSVFDAFKKNNGRLTKALLTTDKLCHF